MHAGVLRAGKSVIVLLFHRLVSGHFYLQGESFYNPYIPGVLEKLSSMGLVEESQGARVIKVEGVDIPLIVVKSDGGFNYASTDLAALWYGSFRVFSSQVIHQSSICSRGKKLFPSI